MKTSAGGDIQAEVSDTTRTSSVVSLFLQDSPVTPKNHG